mmetsp:Transcript_24000/g.33561  ORF Transcript_24000/g.33561 Transcript_24000/m.33561 type:complete len:210 (-) Transcript_24000:137-766(-)|eukprot:CAMPEP_0185253550 /NCGR_PEP_ID=MMETSP1359-20130426/2256_1 /TAXON_ID=552665 /ORGANISM="Bigelowiella longifila, Strain CCMP242" /LENGTH=209 /DNA_ID=CAMNT_0027835947 /DNA_START=118 /DNA_END=747 /DNA_ORIENTATION=-
MSRYLLLVTFSALSTTHIVLAAKCPPLSQVQKPEVVANYNISKHTGRFFEILFMDTVETFCTCFWKNRVLTKFSLHDDDRLFCGAMDKGIWFNVTEENYLIPGQKAAFNLVMESPIIRKIHFPNKVLGYGDDKEGKYEGKYVWTIEYQCIEKQGSQVYMGLNLYHREWNPPAEDIEAMKQVFINSGLQDHWIKLKHMGSEKCNYPSEDV